MRIKRRHVRRVAGVAALLVCVPVAGQLLIFAATRVGVYHGDGGALLAQLTSRPWFHWVGGMVLGFAGGVWIAKVMRASEPTFAGRPAEPPPSTVASAIRLNFAEVETTTVAEDLLLKLNLAVFNGGARALVIKELAGSVQYRPLGSQAEFQTLAKPNLIEDAQPLPAFGDCVIRIEQFAAGLLAAEMLKHLDGPGVELDLSDLDIIVTGRGARHPAYRIPIWHRLAVHKQKTRQYTGRALGDTPQMMKEWLQPRP